MTGEALPIETPDGLFWAEYSGLGLRGLHFPGLDGQVTAAAPRISPWADWHRITSEAVLAVLNGKSPTAFPPCDLSGHTSFRIRVWNELRNIGIGQTLSYAEVAQRLGRPGAARAVGGACGANPIPLLIPCHRVLAAGKQLGGFSGGLKWKIMLLKREQVFLGSKQGSPFSVLY